MAGATTYAAFISYSHSEEKTARWLHSKLEGYRTPRQLVGRQSANAPVPKRLGKVFRDREEFAAGGELKKQIEAALDRSQALIVLCSPRAAKSPYVAAEIEYFRKLGRDGHIIPVILDGEPADCFPEPLRDGRERLGADFRKHKDERDGGFLKILAGLFGVGLDELVQRERVKQRWRFRAAVAAGAVFAGLAAAAGVLGVIATQNAELAERRAALMSIETARSQLEEGNTDGSLLVLLEASKALSRSGAPDNLLIAFDEALERAADEAVIAIPDDARLFPGRSGVLVVDPKSGAISLMDGAAAPRPITQSSAEAGGPVFAAELEDGALVVVRGDMKIERHVEGQPPEILGAFMDVADEDRSSISLVSGDVLLLSPERNYDDYDELSDAQVFEIASRQATKTQIPGWLDVSFARLPDGRRALFGLYGLGNVVMVDLDAPLTDDILQRIEDGEATFPNAPPLIEIMQAACPEGGPEAPASRHAAFVDTLDSMAADAALDLSCKSEGGGVLLTVWHGGSAGEFRSDMMIFPDGQATRIDPGEVSEQAGALQASWVGTSRDSEEIGYTTGRQVYVTDRYGELLLDRSFAYPIDFAAFLPSGELLVREGAAAQAVVIDFRSEEDISTRPLEGSTDTNPIPLLHPAACLEQPFTTDSVGGAKLTIAVEGERRLDYEQPVPVRITLDGPEGRHDKVFATHPDQRCVAVAEGGRYIALGEEAGVMVIHDLSRLARGEESRIGSFKADAFGDPSFVGYSSLFFVGSGPSVVVAQGAGPVNRWDFVEGGEPAWISTELYRGNLPVISAEPDATGRRLLMREDEGASNLSARIYSVDANRTWRDIGEDYKWLYVAFSADNEALMAKGSVWRSASRMLSLQEAVTAAQESLSEHCRAFSGENYRASPCWPAALGQ